MAKIDTLITQNVDRLHQRAGSQKVIDLHGRLDLPDLWLLWGLSLYKNVTGRESICPRIQPYSASDGDADVPDDYAKTVTPDCLSCSGTLMPWVFLVAQLKTRLEQCFRQSIDRRVCLSLAARYKCIQASILPVRAKTKILL